jgi:hypothetical protein
VKNNRNTKCGKCHPNVSLEIFICFFKLCLFKYKITTLPVMQDSSHLTIILYSSVIKIVIFFNTKISDNIAESGKVPRMLAAFPC